MSAPVIMDWAVQTGLAVSILILFVMVIRKPVARYLGAKTAYALWALPVIRLFLPAIPILPAKVLSPALPPAIDNTAYVIAPLASEPLPVQSFNWTGMVVLTWLSGAVLWLLWQAYRQHRFQTELTHTTKPAPDSLTYKLTHVAAELDIRRVPNIRMSEQGDGPLVTGLRRPVIILPAGFETDFSKQQQIHALAHELSHLRHGDLWISAAALSFRALNWPNPLVHLAAPQFRADQEAACDARVIAILGDDRSTRTAYADTLLRAARLSKNSAQPMPLGLTISNPLKERLMILKSNPTQRRSLRLALAGAAGLALLATAPLTAAQTPTPPSPPEMDVTVNSVDKQVMKWVTNENGVETKKHVEIITENGETTAWEIDEIGNRIQVPLDSLNMPGLAGDGHMRVMVKKFGDHANLSEEEIEAMVAETLETIDVEELAGADGSKRIIVKRMGPDGEMEVLSESMLGPDSIEGRRMVILENNSEIDVIGDGENSFVFHSGDHMKSKPGMMVDVATKMMDGVNTDDMDRRTRKKVEAAQKALKEAQEALAAAE